MKKFVQSCTAELEKGGQLANGKSDENEKEKEKDKEKEKEKAGDEASGDLLCPVCQEVVENGVVSQCEHIFCKECIETCLVSHRVEEGEEERKGRCPVCTEPIEEGQLKSYGGVGGGGVGGVGLSLSTSQATLSESTTSDEGGQGGEERYRTKVWEQSTKIKALLLALKKIEREEKGTKSVVFSQWTSMLDIVQRALRKHGIHCGRLDGTMTTEDRQRCIETFYSSSKVTVFLVSLKAGGLGLNLVCANKVISSFFSLFLFLVLIVVLGVSSRSVVESCHRRSSYRSCA